MRRYETIFILRPNAGEDEINRIVESTSQIIADEKGSIIELDKWGIKKLAYLIKKETLGYYVYCDYAGTPAAVAEIERKFRIDDMVIKYMTIKTAASITDEAVQEAIAAVTAKANAIAESEEAENVESEEVVKTEEPAQVAEAEETTTTEATKS